MPINRIEFFVPGTPRPGGSKRAFVNRKTGRAIVVEDCKRNPEWRADVRAAAMAAMEGRELFDGPLCLEVTFQMLRPKGHYGKRGLRVSAPGWPATKPDATKLVRALEDAMTGVVWRDDSLVVFQFVTKRYVDSLPGALVMVHGLPRLAERVGDGRSTNTDVAKE